jgi:hypothetical protein
MNARHFLWDRDRGFDTGINELIPIKRHAANLHGLGVMKPGRFGIKQEKFLFPAQNMASPQNSLSFISMHFKTLPDIKKPAQKVLALFGSV